MQDLCLEEFMDERSVYLLLKGTTSDYFSSKFRNSRNRLFRKHSEVFSMRMFIQKYYLRGPLTRAIVLLYHFLKKSHPSCSILWLDCNT